MFKRTRLTNIFLAALSTYTGITAVLLACLLSSLTLCAQHQHEGASGIGSAEHLIERANAIFYTDPDSSSILAGSALVLATAKKQPVIQAKAWHALARTEVLKGDIEQALIHLRSAINNFEKYNQKEALARSYGLMSTAVSKINNSSECIRLLQKAGAIYRETGNHAGLTLTLVNLANVYTDTRQYDKALEALNESKLYTAPGSNEWFYYYINAGLIQMGRKNYGPAKSAFDSCILIAKRHRMVDAEVTALTRMGEAQAATKNMPEAHKYFDRALTMSRANHLPLEESEALQDLVRYYEQAGDYKNAFISQNRLKKISDSLFNIEKIKNINTIEARLKVSEKEKTIVLQRLNMEQSAAEQEKNKQRITLLFAGSVVLVLILFFTLYVYNKVSKQKKEVEIQKNRVEKLNSLNQKIFAVIAHDFKSPMITLQMLMDLLDKEHIGREDLSAYTADVRNQITQSGQILDNLLNWARSELNISQAVPLKSNPSQVAGEIIKELNAMCRAKNILILNKIPMYVFLAVPPDIIRIVLRNLLSNAVKFSFANSSIVAGLNEEQVFYVADSGAGINAAMMSSLFNGTVQSRLGTSNETGFGLGLHITYELVNKFNGKIWVEHNQPSGTVFKLVLPLHA